MSAHDRYLDPPEEIDYTCPDCDGSGTMDVGTGEEIVCQRCKGHGSLESVVADAEVERQVEAAAKKAEDVDVKSEWSGVHIPL